MSSPWIWDPTLFSGTAPYYRQGRLPYAPNMAEAVREALQLDGQGRLLDVGCGPGTVTLPLSHLFDEAVGLDPDQAMLDEAVEQAATLGISKVTWLCMRAEELPARLGTFRVAAFGQSFHWMDCQRVAAAIFQMLETGGAFLHVNQEMTSVTPPPTPPYDAVKALVQRYLGTVRRAGQGTLPHGTPDGEGEIIESSGFLKEAQVRIPGGEPIHRSVDDVIAWVFSRSDSAPYLFGDRVSDFEGELRGLLAEAVKGGTFIEPWPDTVLRMWRKSST